jgi:hypothetical protein
VRRAIRWGYLAPLALGFAAAVTRALRPRGLREAARERELPFLLYAAVFLTVYLGSSFAIDPNGHPVKYRILLTIAILLVPPAARSAALWIERGGARRGAAVALTASALLASGIATVETATRSMQPETTDPRLRGFLTRGLLTHRKYEDDPQAALALLRAVPDPENRKDAFRGFGWGLEYRYEMDGDLGRIQRWLGLVEPDERELLLSGTRWWAGVRSGQLDDLIRRGRGRPLERDTLARLNELIEWARAEQERDAAQGEAAGSAPR